MYCEIDWDATRSYSTFIISILDYTTVIHKRTLVVDAFRNWVPLSSGLINIQILNKDFKYVDYICMYILDMQIVQ